MTGTRCAATTQSETPCRRTANTAVDGSPMCTQHARAAGREVARAAQQAAFWEALFTPTPEEPYRADPEWQAAKRAALADDSPGESATESLPGRITAIYRIWEIEATHEEIRRARRRGDPPAIPATPAPPSPGSRQRPG